MSTTSLDLIIDVLFSVRQSLKHIPKELERLDCFGIDYRNHINPLITADYILESVISDIEDLADYQEKVDLNKTIGVLATAWKALEKVESAMLPTGEISVAKMIRNETDRLHLYAPTQREVAT